MKENKLTAALLAVALFLVYDNAYGQVNSDANLPEIKKTIQNINILYFNLFKTHNVAIVNLYTDDASLLAPNAHAVSGRRALVKDFEDTFAAGKVKGVKFQTIDIYDDGKQYVTEEGTWQVFNPKGKIIDDGKYLKLWKKTNKGWKIFRDFFNNNHKEI